MEFEDFYPTFEEIRELQEKHFSQSTSHLLSKEESNKLYDSQKYKDCIGEGDYINDQEEGIWTEWYECKFRDENDLQVLRYKALIAEIDRKIDDDLAYIEDYEKEGVEKITSIEFGDYLMIKRRLKEFNGCLKIVSNYVSGKKEYLSTGYGENNEVRFKCHYKNDNFHGRFTEWYENGQIKSQESYKENIWHGKHNYWYESGQKMKESIDINGLYEGIWITWYENGQKWEEGNYRKEKKEGLWTKWDVNGQIISQETYNNGK